jgi:hypothetical protein
MVAHGELRMLNYHTYKISLNENLHHTLQDKY